MNEQFICKICDTETGFKDNFVYCNECNIYWGESAESIAMTLETIQMKNVFINRTFLPERPHKITQTERILYEVAFAMFLLAVLLWVA